MIYKANESIIVIQAEAINPIQTGVVFWSHDRGTAKLRFKLQKDGVNQNLPEGTTVPIRLIFPSPTAQGGYANHDYLATIEDRLNGIVSIVLEDNILGYQGRVDGSIYIEFPNDQSLDTAGRFSFAIKRSPIDDTTPELENYYFNGFSQTIDKIEKMIADAKTEINTKAAETKKEFDTELESAKTSIIEAETSLTAMNEDMDALEEKIIVADQHFVSKESVEKGPLILKSMNITTEDWNDITTTGIYYCAAATGANMPYSGTLYGFLTVYNELAVITQKYEFNNSVYMRTFAGNPATWGSWIKIANASEVVNLTEPQLVSGLKNFKDGLQIAGKEVATVQEDTGWVNLTAINGHSWNKQGQVRKIGKLVIFRGSLKGSTLSTQDFCTIPEEFRPSNPTDNYEYQFLLPPQSSNSLDNGGMAYIRPNGVCGLPSFRGTVNLFLAPIQYFVD